MRTRVIASMIAALLLTVAVAGSGGAPAGADGRGHGSPRIGAGLVHLDGGQEVGGGDTDGRGRFAYVAFPRTLCYVLTVRNIEPATMAHIHKGARGVNGPIAINLTTPTRGFSAGCIATQPDDTPAPGDPAVLTPAELDAIRTAPEGFYANVHNTPFPGGAVRGQLR